MVELDLNYDKSELTKMVAKAFAHISRVMLDDHCSSSIDVLTQSNTLIFEKLIYQQHLKSIHLHNYRKFSSKMIMHVHMCRPGRKTISKENLFNKFFGPGKQSRYEYY